MQPFTSGFGKVTLHWSAFAGGAVHRIAGHETVEHVAEQQLLRTARQLLLAAENAAKSGVAHRTKHCEQVPLLPPTVDASVTQLQLSDNAKH